MHLAKLLLTASALFLIFFGTTASAQGKVPAGFEALFEKQTTLLDVYFGGTFVVSALAEFNTDEVTFANPEVVAQHLPGLTDRQLIEKALRGALYANAQLRCYTRDQTDCGVLEPEVAGIIFDEDRFRVDVFVNREYQVLQVVPKQVFLPRSDAGWSFLQNFGNAFAGNDDDAFETYSLNGASMVANRETRFLLTTNYSNISDWTADEILVRRDFQGRENQVGYFQTTNDASLRFIPEVSLRGIRSASTLSTRNDLDSSSGRDLSIFLVNRSRVSLFKDGRLVSSRSYDAGNQLIDTSRLPGGAYPITIRIEDASGRRREEQRFYVKSNRFPPTDQTLWGVELGEQVLRNSQDFIPESEDVFFGRFSISKRVTDSLAMNGGIAARDTDSILELGVDHIASRYDLQLNGAVSSESGYGLSADVRTRWGDISLYGNYRETWTDNDSVAIDTDPDDEEALQALAAGDSFFSDDSRQWSTTLDWYVGGGTLRLNVRNTRLSGQNNVKEYTGAYTYPIIRAGAHRLELDFEVSKFNELKQALVSLRYRWDKGNFSNSAGTQYQYRELDSDESDSDLEYEAGTSWQRPSTSSGDLAITGRASHRADFDDATGGLNWRGRYGELDTEIRHERRNDDSQTFYSGVYYSSFAWAEGKLAMGGDEQSRSAILIELIGEPSDDIYFDVIVNNSWRGIARIGQRNLITIQPFETYTVEIVPRGEGFVSYEQRGDEVTLYPGNVATLSWDVSPVNILFGRLLDQTGEPVANAVLRGATGLAMTDDYGYFQAELQASVTTLQAETRTLGCTVELPDYTTNNSIGLLGDITCNTVPK